MSPWTVLVWVLDACAFILLFIGYWRFSRKANRIPLPDFAPLDPEGGFSPYLWKDTMDLRLERLDERIALREQGLRWNRRAIALAVVAALLALGNLVAVLLR